VKRGPRFVRSPCSIRDTPAATPTALLNRTFAAVRECCGEAEQRDDVTVAVMRFLKSTYAS
jgi:hypothetical protein